MHLILRRIAGDVKQYKWAAAAFLIYYFVVRSVFHAFCPLLILTGFPCPGCGTTRAVICIFTGHFVRAWNLNPCAYLWVIFGVWFCCRRYIMGKSVRGMTKWLAVIAAAMFAVYLYRMATVFPGYPPMSFKRDNILNRLLPFYNDLLRHLFGI